MARRILIPVDVEEGYQTALLRRLQEYGFAQHDVAQEMGVDDSQFSRWVARPSDDTGKPTAIRLDNVMKIELALHRMLARKKKTKK